jgi:hypothetical protein
VESAGTWCVVEGEADAGASLPLRTADKPTDVQWSGPESGRKVAKLCGINVPDMDGSKTWFDFLTLCSALTHRSV